jgi:hypothetical protein
MKGVFAWSSHLDLGCLSRRVAGIFRVVLGLD